MGNRVTWDHYIHNDRLRTFGPFAAAAVAGGAITPLTMVLKRTRVDQVSFLASALTTVANDTVRVGYATSGQTLAAAAAAGQYLTAAVDVSTDAAGNMVANTLFKSDDGGSGETDFAMDGQTNADVILEPGTRIFIEGAGAATALAGLFVGLAMRETIG